MLVWVAAPELNKQPDVQKPAETVMAHQVQIQEMELPQLPKQEAVQVVSQSTPTQSIPKVEGCEAVRAEVQKYGDWNHSIMVAISKAESGCRSNARGDNHLTFTKNGRTYGYSLGLFQVRILPGRERCDTYDVQANVRCAHDIFQGQGYNAWSVFKNGAYKRHM